MSDDKLFFKFLEERNMDLFQTAVRKKYTFLVPSAKYLSSNMLTRHFYDNHTFYQCEYDPTLMVSLCGKVMQIQNGCQFNTFLGFKKEMQFNNIDEVNKVVSLPGSGSQGSTMIKYVKIDNIIDENSYNPMISHRETVTKGKDILKRFSSKEEYLTYFKLMIKKNPELNEVESLLNDIEEKLKNNYILIKNHVKTYAMYFQQEGVNFRNVS